jgi:hypothetical protein
MRLPSLAVIPLLLVSGCCAAEKANLVELTTRLGVKATVVVGKVSHPDFLLDRHASGWETATFLLNLGPGAYLGVPLWLLDRVERRGTVHRVILVNGRELHGQLECTLQSHENEKLYDLRTVERLVRLGYNERDSSMAQDYRKPSSRWKLKLTRSMALPEDVCNPSFSFRYWSSEGYYVGGSDENEESSEAFFLKTGGEEVAVNLSDFASVTLVTTGPQLTVKVVSASGVTTTGLALLRAKDRKARPPMSFDLSMYDLDGVEIILKSPNCILTRVADRN